MWRWKLVESKHVPDQWNIYAKHKWFPFWIFQDTRSDLVRAAEQMLCLKINSEPPSCG